MNHYTQMRRHSIIALGMASTLLLIAGFLVGLFHPSHTVELMARQLQTIAKTLQTNHSVIQTVWVIFYHNLIVAILMVATGTLAGIYPVFMMWFNGVLVGYVVGSVAQHTHMSDVRILLYSIVPHGIFELTALLWACALGLHLGFTAIQSIAFRVKSTMMADERIERRGLVWRTEVIYCIRRLPWIVVLLFLAACIEGTITPRLIHYGLHVS